MPLIVLKEHERKFLTPERFSLSFKPYVFGILFLRFAIYSSNGVCVFFDYLDYFIFGILISKLSWYGHIRLICPRFANTILEYATVALTTVEQTGMYTQLAH